MRKPFDLDIIGKNLADLPPGTRNLKESGSYAGQGPVDAIPRLLSGAPAQAVLCRGRKAAGECAAHLHTEATRIGASDWRR